MKGSEFAKILAVSAVVALIFGVASWNQGNSSSNASSRNSYPARAYTPSMPQKQKYTCGDGTVYESYGDYLDCQDYYNWKKTRDERLAECNADSSKFNCRYDDYPGTTLYWNYYINTPKYSAPESNGTRYGAICRDGTRSNATGRGACSHHGGVSTWLTY